jgi:hypothetical protein
MILIWKKDPVLTHIFGRHPVQRIESKRAAVFLRKFSNDREPFPVPRFEEFTERQSVQRK